MAAPVNCCCNILWFIFGGFFSFLGWMISGVFLCMTIIGIPFGIQAFKIGLFVLFPFGKDIVPTSLTLSCCQTCGNIIWLLLFGLLNAIFNTFFGIICFITIIGIPFGYQFFKIAKLALTPFGYDFVELDELKKRLNNAQPIVEYYNPPNINVKNYIISNVQNYNTQNVPHYNQQTPQYY